MGKFLKKFRNHSEYEEAESSLRLPNVSVCVQEKEMHYTPKPCQERTVYEVIGTPSYPSTIEGTDTSFDITVSYKRTDISSSCTKTITEGIDAITIECGQNPSTSDTRTISGTVGYHGNEIEYNVVQSKFEVKIVTVFNITNTSNATRIASGTSNFSAIEIDGVEQSSVTTGYTFDTLGEHTVVYTLVNPTIIGYSAFRNCSRLISIEIPNTIINIEGNVFYDCSNLTSINIPSGVRNIGQYAFQDCNSLTSIGLPNTLASIGQGAFQGSKKITSIEIPDSVTSIAQGAFYGCSGLTTCTIGSGITNIGNNILYNCTKLTSITVNAVTPPSLGNGAFTNTNDCPIYVPNDSVNAYKSATNWNTYESRIQAIV